MHRAGIGTHELPIFSVPGAHLYSHFWASVQIETNCAGILEFIPKSSGIPLVLKHKVELAGGLEQE